jgi:hypothetical protein
MQIFVTNVHTGRKLTIEIEGDDTVDKLKEKVEKEGEKVKNDSFIIRPALQRLISHNSVVMLGGRKLSDYGVKKHAELKLSVRKQRAEQQGAAKQEVARLMPMTTGLENRWSMVVASAWKLEEDKQALVQTNSGGKLEDKLQLNVGGKESLQARRAQDALPFP